MAFNNSWSMIWLSVLLLAVPSVAAEDEQHVSACLDKDGGSVQAHADVNGPGCDGTVHAEVYQWDQCTSVQIHVWIVGADMQCATGQITGAVARIDIGCKEESNSLRVYVLDEPILSCTAAPGGGRA